ncbi:exodeoxyribonuclease [Sulfuricella sp. T08]|uniref:exodeoxyribonuclease VII small subunit n=1 Tax=Sulfuricella sp. T08 TaxID=1632857 RepID=UPI0006179DC3|nr:exodeoxyribonuclease VII small subunit [Sulfuricella sp. T08]GAO35339.1 exodeoxyribonuclease [Sulfuricella sp. T08]
MSKASKSPTFESALAELENIVATMEAGQLPLEQLLSAYKRGAELLQFCQQALQDAQQQVRILEAGSLQNFVADTDIPLPNPLPQAGEGANVKGAGVDLD